MNLDILHPGKAVDSAFAKPNMLLALILVLLPAIASIAVRMLYGVQIAAADALYGIVLSYVRFFVLVLVVFALAMLLKRQATKGKFAGLFSAISLIEVVGLAIVVVSIIAVPLVFSQEAINAAVQAGKSPNMQMTAAQISQFVEATPSAVNFIALAFFFIVGLVLLLWGFCLLCLAVKRLAENSSLAAVLLALIALIVVGALPI